MWSRLDVDAAVRKRGTSLGYEDKLLHALRVTQSPRTVTAGS